jgi:integrase
MGDVMAKVHLRKWTTRSGEEKSAWIADYFDADRHRHIKTFKRKKDADAYLLTVAGEVRDGTHVAPAKSETVAEAAQRWLNRVEADGREASTVRQYRQHVQIHIVPRIGNVKLGNLTAHVVENFRDGLLDGERKLSRAMARKVLVSFKSILRTARRSHLAEEVSIGRSKREERKLEAGRDFPSREEIGRLIRAAGEFDMRHRALLAVAIFTGLRASELRGLRWQDVDLNHGSVHVRQRADRYCKIGNPKSSSSSRSVPIDPFVVKILKEWKLACPKGELSLVFPSAAGNIEHHSNMLRGLAPVLLAAGLKTKVGRPKYALHAFRHFFASWCINRKVEGGRELPVKVVQELLGHSSIVMTLDRYGHLFPRGDDRNELAASVSGLLALAT